MVNKKLKVKSALVLFFLTIPLILQIILIAPQKKTSNVINDPGDLQTSALVSSNTTQWLADTGFNYPGNWSSSFGGDTTDIDTSIGGGIANYTVIGDYGTYNNISGTPLVGDWTETNNSIIKLDPDSYGIDGNGCWTSHHWEDGADTKQLTAIEWDRNITLPVDMSDYNITTVFLSAVASGNVQADNGATEGVDIMGENDSTGTHNGDFARFYVVITDIYKTIPYEIASFQTFSLGDDSAGDVDTLLDTFLTNLDNETIIYHLTSILNLDPDHRTFTLTLGIRIWSEDNWSDDDDQWNDLRIETCDLSFTYKKITSQLSSASWNQDGEKISDISNQYEVVVTNALLNFYYKIDQDWPTSLSPSSEFRVLINNNPIPETIKLDLANTTFQIASASGYDVTKFITDDVRVSVQVYLRDEFGLDHNITVSIDNVSLIISYNLLTIEIIPPPWLETYGWLVVVLAAGLVGLGGYFVAYELVFKYPAFVRLIRKLRKKVKKEKKLKSPITVESRESLRISKLKEKMKILRIDISTEGAGSMVSSKPSGMMEKVGKGGIQK